MARPLRVEYPGAVYHVTARGNAREAIFFEGEDRESFLSVLAAVVERINSLCHAYCLMDNYYHLLVETPDANLPQAMRQLNGVYTEAFNCRHGRVGHLFQGRFKSILVDKVNYLLGLARYVVLNPVRAGIVRHPRYWRWSSYTATSGEKRAPDFLTTGWILGQFSPEKREVHLAYRRVVAEGKGVSGWDGLRGGVLLGSDGFVKRLAPLLKDKQLPKGVPKAQQFAARPSLSTLFRGAKRSREKRNERVREAYMERGYTLTQIGDYLGLHYSTVGRIAQREMSNSSRIEPSG